VHPVDLAGGFADLEKMTSFTALMSPLEKKDIISATRCGFALVLLSLNLFQIRPFKRWNERHCFYFVNGRQRSCLPA